MGIERLNWGWVGPARPPWAPASGRLWALWPSPVDHDACFEAAGFHDMADTDATWEDDFCGVLGRLLTAFDAFGASWLTEGAYPRRGRRVFMSPRDVLLAAATDDAFPPCIVSFGEPARASVRTSDGHPLFWLWLDGGASIEAFLPRVAAGLPTREAVLGWEQLW